MVVAPAYPSLSAVTQQLGRRLGVRHAVLPMSDTPVRTRVVVDRGELAFQDYFVRLRCRPRVRAYRYAGIGRARAPALLTDLLASSRVQAIVICPSNPYVSVAPILRVPAIRRWLATRRVPVLAVSPIVGGAASLDAVGAITRAGTNCGSCRPEIRALLRAARLRRAA